MTAPKKTKYMTGKPFTVQVCDAIRHHVASRQALESKRGNAFDDRDAAKAELGDLKDKHGPDALKVKEKHSDAIIQIEDLSARIKFHSNQVDELVEKADEPEFEFMYDFEDSKEPEDNRPVGKPGTPKPQKGGKPDLKIAGADQPEGWNQHLEADINELGCNDKVKSKLKEAGFNKISELWAYAIRDGKQLAMVLNAGENAVSAAMRALKSYLEEHTAADVEVTKKAGGSTR